MSAWKPIETAPAGPLWLWCPQWKMTFGGRRKAQTPSAAAYGTFLACTTEGWIEVKPTHWMSLPEPPK